MHESNIILKLQRDSRKAGSLWGMMRGVGGVRKSIYGSRLAKELRIGLGLLCWGFKGVQEEIPSEEANTLQIGQWHFHQDNTSVNNSILVTDNLTKMSITAVPQPPYCPDLAPCDFWLFPKLRSCHCETIEVMKEALTKVIDTLTQEDFPGTFKICWNGTTSSLQSEELISKGSSASNVYYQ